MAKQGGTNQPKKIIAVKNGASQAIGGNGGQQRTRMGNNQLTGINSNPMHVLSAGAGDLLAGH